MAGFPRRPVRAFFTKVKGYVTRKPPVRAIRTLFFASSQRSAQRVRYRTRAFFLKIRRAAAVVAAQFPWRIRVLRPSRRRPIQTRAFFLNVKGYVTRRPPIRAVRTVLFATQARAQRRIMVRSYLRDVVRTWGQVVARFPQRIKVLGRLSRRPIRTRAFFVRARRAAAVLVRFPWKIRVARIRLVRRPVRLTTRFTRAFGYVTKKPPVRRIRVVMFASQARMRRERVHGWAGLGMVVRTWTVSGWIYGQVVRLVGMLFRGPSLADTTMAGSTLNSVAVKGAVLSGISVSGPSLSSPVVSGPKLEGLKVA
jgi:hypothetical protein